MGELIVIIVCLVLNAAFAAYEMSFISVQRNELQRLAENGSRIAAELLKLRENPERFLSVVQIGITLVGAIAAAVGGAGAAENIEPWLVQNFEMKVKTADFLSAIMVVIPITYFSVVVGELVPKTLALRNPLKLLIVGGPAFIIIDKFLSPVVTILEKSTKLLLKFFPKTKEDRNESEESVTIDDLPAHQKKLVLNLIEIEEKSVKDVYTKWEKAVWVDFDDDAHIVHDKIIQTRHTRLPVLRNNEVYGILNTKEFTVLNESNDPDWQSLIREPLRVKGSDKLLGLVKLFQSRRTKMAFVYIGGNLSGMITFDDVLEEVFGEIKDEDDDGRAQKLLAMRSRLK